MSFFVLSTCLFEIHADKYKIEVIFKSSEGCKTNPPTIIHLLAPQNSEPKNGIKTKINKNKFISNKYGANFFMI